MITQQHYCSTLPIADPSLIVTSNITSTDALLLSVILTVNEVSFSATEYCDWLNDTIAPSGQQNYIT